MKRIIADLLAKTTLVTLLVVAALAEAAECQSATQANFIVIDSTGAFLGRVVSTDQGGGLPTIAVPYRGKFLLVALSRDYTLSGTLYFTSTDCSGQAYADPSTSPFLASAVGGPNDTLYFEDGSLQNVNVQSVLYGGYICDQNGCQNLCNAQVGPLSLVPMSAAENLNVWVPPFKVSPGS
jgi:hypothetical protein